MASRRGRRFIDAIRGIEVSDGPVDEFHIMEMTYRSMKLKMGIRRHPREEHTKNIPSPARYHMHRHPDSKEDCFLLLCSASEEEKYSNEELRGD